MSDPFRYETAFARNIGWVTPAEQAILRAKRVAIAGLGGVGGSHLLTLTRLGVGAFHLSDFDRFELANFNRQAGASVSHLDRPKLDVLTGMARDINPELDIRGFADGINADNIDTFLDGVDLYLDGLDFFAVAARRSVFAACARLGIPAVTAAPLGMGVALLNFLPGEMSFEEYFQLEGQDETEQLLRFLLGLSPAMLQRGYLVEPDAVDFRRHRGPSTPMACELCAGLAATEVLKILLARGPVKAAPHGLHFDAYRGRLAHTWRPGGNRHPLQQLGLKLARRQFTRVVAREVAPPPRYEDPRLRLLDAARWAPSGDNTQPWRFELLPDDGVRIHGRDTRAHCVYDLQGHASLVSIGALLETLDIAASGEGLLTHIVRDTAADETTPTFDVHFSPAEQHAADPLLPYIRTRSVQRRGLRMRALHARERGALADCLPEGYRLVLLEGLAERWRAARMTFACAGLRLTLPEAYPVHRDVIDWDNPASPDRIPAGAIGLDPLMLRVTRWAMASWERINFLNRYMAGTLMPRLQLDLWPGLACGAHFALIAPAQPADADDYIAAGRATQRLWLTVARLGLQLQPEMTPLIFHEYLRENVNFTQAAPMYAKAADVSRRLRELLGDAADRAVFFGRLGAGHAPRIRSMRRPLQELLVGGLPAGGADQKA